MVSQRNSGIDLWTQLSTYRLKALDAVKGFEP